MSLQRIIATLVLIVAFFATPWWAWGILGVVFVVVFPWYVEFIVLAFVGDSMLHGERWGSSYVYTIGALVVCLGYQMLRTRIFLVDR